MLRTIIIYEVKEMKKRLKMFFALSICAVVAISTVGSLISVKAASEVKLEVSSHEINKADEVEVSVNIVQNPGICSLSFEVQYDENVMTLKGYQKGDTFADIIAPQSFENGPFKFEGSSTGLIDTQQIGTFVTLVFEVKETAPAGASEVRLVVTEDSAYNVDEQLVPISVTNGTVKVLCQHESKTQTVTKEPTCTEEGEEQVICDECGETVGTNPIGELGHLEKWVTTENPTCTSDGLRKLVCERCNAELETENIPMIPHEFGEWNIVTEASCTGSGLQERVCVNADCTEKESQEIAALGHAAGEWQEDKPATCTEEGKKFLTCTRCHAAIQTVVIDALGHNWGEWMIEKEATFNEEGSAYQLCARCSERQEKVLPKLSESHECDFVGREEVIKVASCAEAGSKRIFCSTPECGKFTEEEIPAVGHVAEEEWETVTEAECEIDGLKIKKCSACGNEVERLIIPSLGHDWEEEVIEEATCTEQGLGKRTCINCGIQQSVNLDLAAHVEGELKEVKEATCMDKGKKELRCQVCDTILKEVTIPALGHTWGDWSIAKEATEQETGLKERKCTVCELIEQEVIEVKKPEKEEAKEEPKEESTSKPDNQFSTQTEEKGQTTASQNSVKTGDTSMSMAGLGAVSMIAAAALVVLVKKRCES